MGIENGGKKVLGYRNSSGSRLLNTTPSNLAALGDKLQVIAKEKAEARTGLPVDHASLGGKSGRFPRGFKED